MAKGKNNRAQAANNVGGSSNQRNVLAAKVEASLVDQLKPGRHPCSCQARVHALVSNCMGCGKIICVQEGSGPCFFCDNLVVTREEQEVGTSMMPNDISFSVLDRGSKKSTELLAKLLQSVPAGSTSKFREDLKKATTFRDKLLEADADSERRNKVNDMQSDYASLHNNPYLSEEERRQIKNRRDELQAIREQRRKQILVNIMGDGSISETKQTFASGSGYGNDPIIHSILQASEDRRQAAEVAYQCAADERLAPNNFVPKYDKKIGRKFLPSTIAGDIDVDFIARANEQIMELEVESKGYTLALQQPFASLVVEGKINAFLWSEDLFLKGPVFIASKVSKVTEQDVISATKKYCRSGIVYGSSGPNLENFSSGSLLGRVYIADTVTVKEYKEMYDTNAALAGSGDFVLVFTAVEPLTTPVPHIPPSNFYQLDKTLKDALIRA